MIARDQEAPGMHGLYTTAQLSRILGVPASRVRAWVRQALIEPARVVRRLCFFDFEQLAGARTLRRLLEAGVKPARIRRSLEQLRAWLPDADASLNQLEALERAGPLLVRTEEGRLAETSGQLRLDFERHEGAASLRLDSGADAGGADRRAQHLFDDGMLAEAEGRLEEAAAAYERALALQGPAPEVCFNLGNVLYAQGRPREAATRFREAVSQDPEYVEAWNNLGNVLCDMQEHAGAVAAFERALGLEPEYADAHYNLAETLASHGDTRRARSHWRAYLELDPHSAWAEEVRKRLERTRGERPPLRLDERTS